MTDLVILNWSEHLAQLPELRSQLTDDEVTELSLRRHADRSLMSRGLLRKFLSERLPGQKLDLVKNENGKLFLKNSQLNFSIAHSGNWMAFAFHPSKKIGVDLETWDRADQILRFAPRYFKKPENNYIQKDPNQISERALQIWTCKEAWLKALGTTVFAALEHQEIPLTLGGKIDSSTVTFEHRVEPQSYYLTVATTND